MSLLRRIFLGNSLVAGGDSYIISFPNFLLIKIFADRSFNVLFLLYFLVQDSILYNLSLRSCRMICMCQIRSQSTNLIDNVFLTAKHYFFFQILFVLQTVLNI